MQPDGRTVTCRSARRLSVPHARVLLAVESRAADSAFDPDYFRETRPRWSGVDDHACRLAWLTDPAAAGPGTPREHLARLGLDLATFPAAFPWQYYARQHPTAGAHRWKALDHFVQHGFAAGETLPFGPEAKDFLVSLARSYAPSADRLAIKAFQLAAGRSALEPDELQHLADSYLREGLWAAARDVYERVLESTDPSVWTVHNCALASMELGEWASARRVLTRADTHMRADPAWRSVADALLRRSFDHVIQTGRSLYAQGHYDAGDQAVADGVTRALDQIAQLAPPAFGSRARSHVLVIANQDDPVTLRYRVRAKPALARNVGKPCSVRFINEIADFDEHLEQALAVIFVETAATPDVLKVLAAARSAGIPTIYEANGPIFDPGQTPPPIETFAGLITPALHDDLRLHAVLCWSLARHCDVGIASAARTTAKLAALVRGQRAHIVPNVPEAGPVSSLEQHLPETFLFLRSGRFLRLTDEPRSLGAAILALLGDGRIGIVLSGHVKLTEAFNRFDDQIVELGPSADPASYDFALARAAFNLAPEAISEDDGVVQVSWLEAATHQVATVMSPAMAESLGFVGTHCCLVAEPTELPQVIAHALGSQAATLVGRAARELLDAARSGQDIARPFAQALGLISHG
jgi:hypothetical protein